MAGSVASKAARDALFLDRFRAIDLPYVDIAIAAHRRHRRQRLHLGRLTAPTCATCRSAACCSSRSRRSRFWPDRSTPRLPTSDVLFIVIYIWVGVFCVLAPSQVWTLANYVLTTREAKRSFGFIGSGAILGWIVGGFATRAARLALRHREHAPVGGGDAALLGAALVWLIWRDRPQRVGTTRPPAGDDEAATLFAQPRADSRVAVPDGHRRRHLARGVRDHDRRLAVQGDRQGQHPGHRRAGDVLRHRST